MDVDALIRRVLRDNRRAADRTLRIQANEMKGLTDQQTHYNNQADELQGMAARGDEPDSEITVMKGSTRQERKRWAQDHVAFLNEKGQEVPGWLKEMAKTGNPGKATKSELEALASAYTNAANSVGGDIQMLTLDIQSSTDRRNEATEHESAWNRGRHDAVMAIIQNSR